MPGTGFALVRVAGRFLPATGGDSIVFETISSYRENLNPWLTRVFCTRILIMVIRMRMPVPDQQ